MPRLPSHSFDSSVSARNLNSEGPSIKRWTTTLLLAFGLVAASAHPATGHRLPVSAPASQTDEEPLQLIQRINRLRAEGKYAEAIPLTESLLIMVEKEVGPEHKVTAQVVGDLAELHRLTGDLVRAEPLYRRSLAIREKVLGPAHPDVAVSLNNFGLLYLDGSDYTRAEALFQRALKIYETAAAANPADVTATLVNLGLLYMKKGDYQRAEPFYRRALAIAEKVAGPEHPTIPHVLNSLAELYRARGDYAAAEPLYLRALAIREKVLGSEHPDVAISLSNLGLLYHQKGDYLRPESLYRRALAIFEKILGPHHPAIAHSLINLAELYKARGDYSRAEPLLQRALVVREKAYGPEHPEVAFVLGNLADLYEKKEEYDRAGPMYQRSLAIYEKVWGAEHLDVARILTNLAGLYAVIGDHMRAEELYQRAIRIREKALGPEHPDLAISFNNLAVLYMLFKGDPLRAEPLFRRTHAILEKTLGPEHPDVASSFHNLASVSDEKGDVAQAVAFQTRTNDIEERNLALILTTGSEDQKRLYLRTLVDMTAFTLSLNTSRDTNNPEATRLALTTVLRRKGRALDATSDQVGALRRRLNPQDRALLEKLSAARAELATLVLGGPGQNTPARRQEGIARLNAEIERLEGAVSSRSTEFRALAQPVTIERVQEALPADAALIELVVYRPYVLRAKTLAERLGPPRYVAYVLGREGSPTWVDLGQAAPIDEGVTALRRALSNPQSKDVKQLARALDEQVMRPVRKLLGKTRVFFLSPDGALNLIPFGALVDEQNRYLLENYSITYLTSGRDLLRLSVKAESKQGPVVIANPQFDQGPGNQPTQAADAGVSRSADFSQLQFGQLKGTAEEARALEPTLPSVKILTEAQATEAALKQVSGPSILHVATHGFFLPDQPQQVSAATRGLGLSVNAIPAPGSENPLLRSGLALAGANKRVGGGGEDGILTALEASGLDLWGTKLVVLSACETGVGEVKNGDGVYGLRRALLLAGAESQVMSLWQVSDAATRDLMVAYYKRLQMGEGRSEALRTVQLEMLGHGEQGQVGQSRGIGLESSAAKQDRSHPFFWASFIQSGEWKKLQ